MTGQHLRRKTDLRRSNWHLRQPTRQRVLLEQCPAAVHPTLSAGSNQVREQPGSSGSDLLARPRRRCPSARLRSAAVYPENARAARRANSGWPPRHRVCPPSSRCRPPGRDRSSERPSRKREAPATTRLAAVVQRLQLVDLREGADGEGERSAAHLEAFSKADDPEARPSAPDSRGSSSAVPLLEDVQAPKGHVGKQAPC